MKIVLIRPPGNDLFRWKSPPLGITSIAGHLRASGLAGDVDISILDFFPTTISNEDALAQISRHRPSIVGISFLTAQAEIAYEFAEALRVVPDVLTVAGGIHPTVCPEEVRDAGFDVVVSGEGEVAFDEIVRQRIRGELGKGYREIRRHALTPSGEIPTPAWDLLDLSLGYNESIGLSDDLAVPLMAARGCAFDCSFCASKSIWQGKIRWRAPAVVVDEITTLMRDHGIHSFHFYDDDFLINKRYAIKLLDALEALPHQIRWTALATVRSICQHQELLPRLKQLGCRGFDVGVETADASVLEAVNKRQKPSDSARALAILKAHGFPYIEPLMMYFNQYETVRSVEVEAEFFRQVGIPHLEIHMHQYATPFPGTAFHETSKLSGVNFTHRWSDYRTDRVNYIPHTFLESDFPTLTDSIPRHALAAALDWSKALDSTDGPTIAVEVWRHLTAHPVAARTVAETAFDCARAIGRQGGEQGNQVLKAVALLAIIAARKNGTSRGRKATSTTSPAASGIMATATVSRRWNGQHPDIRARSSS
jgi:radical SAM superfamily enzyme YgiQ (UPF0313 family)